MNIELNFGTLVGIIAIIISIVSVYFAYKSAKHTRDTVIGATVLGIMETYNSEDIKLGIQHLYNFKNENIETYALNRYTFGELYLEKISESSKEWAYRRKLLLFWTRIGVLLKTNILSEEIIFTLFPNVEIIEILEPIDVALSGKYNAESDQYIGFVYRKWKKWKKTFKVRRDMELPLDVKSYNENKSLKIK